MQREVPSKSGKSHDDPLLGDFAIFHNHSIVTGRGQVVAMSECVWNSKLIGPGTSLGQFKRQASPAQLIHLGSHQQHRASCTVQLGLASGPLTLGPLIVFGLLSECLTQRERERARYKNKSNKQPRFRGRTKARLQNGPLFTNRPMTASTMLEPFRDVSWTTVPFCAYHACFALQPGTGDEKHSR